MSDLKQTPTLREAVELSIGFTVGFRQRHPNDWQEFDDVGKLYAMLHEALDAATSPAPSDLKEIALELLEKWMAAVETHMREQPSYYHPGVFAQFADYKARIEAAEPTPPDVAFDPAKAAQDRAERVGHVVDRLDALRSIDGIFPAKSVEAAEPEDAEAKLRRIKRELVDSGAITAEEWDATFEAGTYATGKPERAGVGQSAERVIWLDEPEAST